MARWSDWTTARAYWISMWCRNINDPVMGRYVIVLTGQRLFEFFLQNESATPNKLAYDRPSFKMIAFLRKHYGLKDYLKQTNNFVLFNEFFQEQSAITVDKKSMPTYSEHYKAQPVDNTYTK